ncbi:hypothetical protein [Geobacter sp. DSM 9736]|uniref:hypothetical protein n=1 Tax=Geobacter sp. DSM 9736 TaxID=1277350 RepID=UPI000B50C415|nr:hypothetical protein [Geobacter sp. DSM 9736]SNB46229.1 hypothetical protein SAMN06269301_1673 [Geobacter sp. DSM 9736]
MNVKRYHESFPAILDIFNLETLEKDPHSIYGLGEDMTLHYLNPGWFRFAEENGGEPAISERFKIGTSILDAISGPLKDFYHQAFRIPLQTGEVWNHDYECSSSETLRVFHLSAYPLHNRKGLVVVNSLIREQPHDRKAFNPMYELYTQKSGMISQCSNCRRVQRPSEPEVWDWVPAWVQRMPANVSHDLCLICYEYYYEFNFRR